MLRTSLIREQAEQCSPGSYTEQKRSEPGPASAQPTGGGSSAVGTVTSAQPDANEFGLEILHPLGGDVSDPIQIIFVHGLGGSKMGTWTHPQAEGCWPDWLHSEEVLKDVRIALFGYDANFRFFTPNTTLGISNFATQLLLEIGHLHFRTRPVLTTNLAGEMLIRGPNDFRGA